MSGLTKWRGPSAWDPLRQLAEIAEELDRAFAELGFPAHVSSGRDLLDSGIAPDLRVSSGPEGIEVALDVPGLRSDALAVESLGDTITIRGEWPEPAVGAGATVWRRERPRGRFTRRLSLGEPFDPASVEARLEDGVLRVTLKRAPGATPRAIQVKS